MFSRKKSLSCFLVKCAIRLKKSFVCREIQFFYVKLALRITTYGSSSHFDEIPNWYLMQVWQRPNISSIKVVFLSQNYSSIWREFHKRSKIIWCTKYYWNNTVWKNEKFSLTEKKIRQITYLVISLVKPMLSRNFCKRSARENFCNFHTVNKMLFVSVKVPLFFCHLEFTWSQFWLVPDGQKPPF